MTDDKHSEIAEEPRADSFEDGEAPKADRAAPDSGADQAAPGPPPPPPQSPFDFRRPAQLSSRLQHRLLQWEERIEALTPVKLSTHVPDLACQVLPHETNTPDLAEPPHPMLAFRVSVNQQFETILGVHRPLALSLVAAMLGESKEDVEDRELTLVEQSVFDLIIRDFVEMLDESGQPLGIRAQWQGGERRTQLIRLFRPGEPILLLNFRLSGGFGAGIVCWIWPQAAIESLFATEEPPAPAPHLPQLAQRLPFDLSVRLGRASLSVQRLARLKPGDVIVLDQTVCDPLVAEIGGVEKLHVWPGRDGTRQAIRVEGLIEDE